jgi:hypothetical protein
MLGFCCQWYDMAKTILVCVCGCFLFLNEIGRNPFSSKKYKKCYRKQKKISHEISKTLINFLFRSNLYPKTSLILVIENKKLALYL